MPLELLEYNVFRFVGQPPGYAEFESAEIDCGVVPTGQTWRADRVTVGVFTALTGSEPPTVLLFDQAQPGPTAVPVDATVLSSYTGFGLADAPYVNNWLDIDDTSAPLTIPSGNQLAIIFEGTEYGQYAQFFARVQFSIFQGDAGTPQPAAGLSPTPTISPSI